MEIKEYYCQGTMLSHEADHWRCKLIDQSFPLFGIAEREDYIAIGFLELNDLIHTRFMFSEYPEVIRGEDCMIFPRCLAWIMHVRSFCATGTPCYQRVSHQVKVPIRTLLIRICRSRSYLTDWKLYLEADNVLI
jgi:hypothetical protein